MLILLSPAKTLDFVSPSPPRLDPPFLDQSQTLIETLRHYDVTELGKLMKLSDKLATLNVSRYASWTGDGEKSALFAFKGDVYRGLNPETLSEDGLHRAQKSLFILSGLYGLLPAFAGIEPHRLEMGTSLPTDRGKNLYAFWGERITQLLNETSERLGSELVVNLASQEYFKSVKATSLRSQVISPVFKDEKSGRYKVISIYAKRARGLLARHLLENEDSNSERSLQAFTSEGYRYDPAGSTPAAPLFIRAEADRPS